MLPPAGKVPRWQVFDITHKSCWLKCENVAVRVVSSEVGRVLELPFKCCFISWFRGEHLCLRSEDWMDCGGHSSQ